LGLVGVWIEEDRIVRPWRAPDFLGEALRLLFQDLHHLGIDRKFLLAVLRHRRLFIFE
jgi:hypothetical protein